MPIERLSTLAACLLAALLAGGCAGTAPTARPEAGTASPPATGTPAPLRGAHPDTPPDAPPGPAPAAESGKLPPAPGGMARQLETARTAPPDFENNVYFATASTALDARGRDTLQAYAAKLKAGRDLRVALTGHTDHLGSREYNLALGQKRVDAVAQELIELGVWSRQIVQRTSYGNELGRQRGCRSEACRQASRRVELQISGGEEERPDIEIKAD